MVEEEKQLALSAGGSRAEDIDPALIIDGKTARGIPKAVFIEDIDEFIAKKLEGASMEATLGAFNELYSKYKMLETRLTQQKSNAKLKMPDIERSIELIDYLVAKQQDEDGEPIRTNFSLADTVYANAELNNDGRVCIWLGANVMVEYSYEQALELLRQSLENAKQVVAETSEDLDFVRNQIITAEVNMARLYNHDVKMRREKTQQEAAAAASAASGSGGGVPLLK